MTRAAREGDGAGSRRRDTHARTPSRVRACVSNVFACGRGGEGDGVCVEGAGRRPTIEPPRPLLGLRRRRNPSHESRPGRRLNPSKRERTAGPARLLSTKEAFGTAPPGRLRPRWTSFAHRVFRPRGSRSPANLSLCLCLLLTHSLSFSLDLALALSFESENPSRASAHAHANTPSHLPEREGGEARDSD